MFIECLIIIVIDYDMISCYYQDMKVIPVYVVIKKRIRGNVLLFFYSTLNERKHAMRNQALYFHNFIRTTIFFVNCEARKSIIDIERSFNGNS